MATQPKVSLSEEPVVRSLQESDVREADRIFRLAFGTFLGLPDPPSFSPAPISCAGAYGQIQKVRSEPS
jgi:hypothetical protein